MMGEPAFLRYPAFNVQSGKLVVLQGTRDVAHGEPQLKLEPRDIQRPNDPNRATEMLLDRQQAGRGKLGDALIDQHGHFVYYAINVNQNFVDFLRHNNSGLDLTDTPTLQNIRKGTTAEAKAYQDLQLDAARFPSGIAEYKSAWMIVDGPQAAPTYFVVPADVPRYVVQGGHLVQAIDTNGQPATRRVSVALLALHVVFTLPGHPEMIWSTFEHVNVHSDASGVVVKRDNAPAAKKNPVTPPPDAAIDQADFPLYRGNTLPINANQPSDAGAWAEAWDEASQSLSKNGGIQTSVYRPYPGSKHDDPTEDDEITTINDNATKMFLGGQQKGPISAADRRQFYRLVGAVWVDQPDPNFAKDKAFGDDAGQAALQGEDRLGSTAMESFTETEDTAPGCFNCHDGAAVRVAPGGRILPGSKMNVTHVLSKYIQLLPRVSP